MAAVQIVVGVSDVTFLVGESGTSETFSCETLNTSMPDISLWAEVKDWAVESLETTVSESKRSSGQFFELLILSVLGVS